jgi:hypothetical protein
VRTASPARRAAGLLAVTTIGLSTAVLSVTGVASAEPLAPYSFTTDVDESGNYDQDALTSLTVLDGYCTIDWTVYGASGGASGDGTTGAGGGGFTTVTTVGAGDVFDFTPGGQGGDAVAGTPELLDADGVVIDPAEPGTPGVGGDNGGAAGAGDDETGLGGGGGGLTEVTMNDEAYLSAFGGDGGSDEGGPANGGAGAGDEENVFPTDPAAEEINSYGDGEITGYVNPCAPVTPPGGSEGEQATVTGAPDAKWVSGVEHGLSFQLWTTTVSEGAPVTGVEYSLDGGSWTGVDTDNQGDFQYSGTITGLETGKTYSVQFRFTTAGGGHTEASAATTGTPVLSAPTDLRAAVGTSSILISWSPPAGADAAAVTGYRAWAIPTGAQSDADVVVCPEMDAAARTCLLGVPAGTVYSVGVAATNGASAFLDTGVAVPAAAISATLPTSNGTLTSSDADGKVVAGEQVTISGKDFLPGSTVELVVYSTPVKLGSAVVLADGTFSATVTLPKDLANGVHHLVATGVDVNGAVRNLVVEVTVSGGTATVSGGLAYTGFTALPFVGAGVLALGLGGGLLVASRRRQA